MLGLWRPPRGAAVTALLAAQQEIRRQPGPIERLNAKDDPARTMGNPSARAPLPGGASPVRSPAMFQRPMVELTSGPVNAAIFVRFERVAHFPARRSRCRVFFLLSSDTSRAVDWPSRERRFDVVYHLLSPTKRKSARSIKIEGRLSHLKFRPSLVQPCVVSGPPKPVRGGEVYASLRAVGYSPAHRTWRGWLHRYGVRRPSGAEGIFPLDRLRRG